MAKPAFSSWALIIKQRLAQTRRKDFPDSQSPVWSTVCPYDSVLMNEGLSHHYLIITLQKHLCLCCKTSLENHCINIDWILKFHFFFLILYSGKLKAWDHMKEFSTCHFGIKGGIKTDSLQQNELHCISIIITNCK